MRLLLVTGPGGSGTTTVAAALAVLAARANLETVLIGLDGDPGLGTVLATDLREGPVTVAPGLVALAVASPGRGDPDRDGPVPGGGASGTRFSSGRALGGGDSGGRDSGPWGDGGRDQGRSRLAAVLDLVGLERVTPAALGRLPDVAGLQSLLELRDQVRTADAELVVVDAGSLGTAVRLLALPGALSTVLRRLLPDSRLIDRALAGRVTARATSTGAPEAVDALVEGSRWLLGELAGLVDLLTGPQASVRLVLTPERTALARAVHGWTTLSLLGYPVDGVVANRVGVPGGPDPWRLARAAAHQELLDRARATFTGLDLTIVDDLAVGPVGPDALAELGRQVLGDRSGADGASAEHRDAEQRATEHRDAEQRATEHRRGAHRAPSPSGGVEDDPDDLAQALLAPPVLPPQVTVEVDDQGYLLGLRVPAAGPEDLQLSRHGDDLVVEFGSVERVIQLTGALRRCVVAGARLRGGVLTVRFEPDPRQWRVSLPAPGSDHDRYRTS